MKSIQSLSLADYLFGNKARFGYLLIGAILLLFTFLGAKDIWTQEHRWADIVFGMFYRNDFLHPYLGETKYYDKPLLSYWLIALIAQLTGALTTWTLRLPSALAGLLAIWSIYRLGAQTKDKELGLLAGWLLLTTFYFVFWARVSSADMLNLAGSLFAVAWYVDHREQNSFFNYAIFFIILALTSLCKGLGGAIIPLVAVFIDLILGHNLRTHIRLSLFVGIFPALIIYFIPFLASSYWSGEGYNQNGLYLVYRENILRYFQPFDHQGHIYTYFVYLPIYLIPWVIFFIPALFSMKRRWLSMSVSSQWLALTLFMLFLFFTLSGSRRSYYVLPIIPFAILFTADWILSNTAKLKQWSAWCIIFSFIFLYSVMIVLPAWYYSKFGAAHFTRTLITEASKMKPWNQWQIVMFDAESKLNFYLQSPHIKQFDIHGNRDAQSILTLQKSWPILKNKSKDVIFISRKRYILFLQRFFSEYRVITIPALSLPFISLQDFDAPIAFIPIQNSHE